MACSGCAAAKKAAQMKQQTQPVRQLPQRTGVTPSAQKQVEFRNRMKYVTKK